MSSNHELELQEQAAAHGAVLYLEKPFPKEKLLMWVKRYAKYQGFRILRLMKIGKYSLDVETRVLSYCDSNVCSLSNTEFTTLKILFANKGEKVTRTELKNSVWGRAMCSDDNLNNVIYRLRKYFERDSNIHFETLRGEGFRMRMDQLSEF